MSGYNPRAPLRGIRGLPPPVPAGVYVQGPWVQPFVYPCTRTGCIETARRRSTRAMTGSR
eukprot:15483722-Alexandrium_andersonii.AAC.1